MRHMVWLLGVLAMICSALVLAGCGGGERADAAAGTMGKPAGGGLPAVGTATGTIYYGRADTGKIIAMNANDGTATDLPVSAAAVDGFEVSYTSPRYVLFDMPVKDWGDVGITNIFVQPVAGGAPVNIINDDTLLSDSPVLTTDGAALYFSGARFDPETASFSQIGMYQAAPVTSGGIPTGVTGVTFLGSLPHGALSPAALSSAAALDPTNNGSPRDIYVGSLAGGSSVNITNTAGVDELPPAWAPSLRLAFGRALVGSRGTIKGYDIYTCLSDGSGQIKAVSSANTGTAWNCFQQAAPAWNPETTQLAFIARQSETGTCAIMRSAADGSTAAKSLTSYAGLIWCVRWRP